MAHQLSITEQGLSRLRGGHLWVYRSDVRGAEQVPGGTVVRVQDSREKFVGQALFSDRSQISLRFLSFQEEVIDRPWWRERLLAAARRRRGLTEQTNAYRLVHAEGDWLPSLVVDVYDGVYVLQTLSQGTAALQEMLVELLRELFEPRAILERNDARARALEGLELRSGVLHGEAPREVEIVEHGLHFLVSPLAGQKTGCFLDQRENHLAARRHGHGRALDGCTFQGGFALHLAAVCESVLGVDISAESVEGARRNALRNCLANVQFREANLFDALRDLEGAGERFDTIVLDPPAFAKNRASVEGAVRGYKEINLRALKLLNAQGILVTCSCSYHVDEALFLKLLQGAALDAGRRVQLVEKRGQATDHPVLLGVPETSYLKCFVLRVL